jgi:hypothetical protein
VGETLAETRVEIDAQRAELKATADRLRSKLDLPAKFRENPALFVGLGVGAVFLAAGGPIRIARLIRRRTMRTKPERAYDSLPKPMQAWVDQLAGAVGPKAEEARQSLATELARWRHDPRKHGKINKELARQMAEGPPGPNRTTWKALEAVGTILSAALARKAVERFLAERADDPPGSEVSALAVGVAAGSKDAVVGGGEKPPSSASVADPEHPADDYSSMSRREDS